MNPVTELTSQRLSERRTKTLRDLASRTSKAKTTDEAFGLSAEALRETELDLPFVLFYLLDEAAVHARLVAAIGLAPGTALSPEMVMLDRAGDLLWPVFEVVRSGVSRDVNDVREHFGTVRVGPYAELPTTAVVLPIAQPGSDRLAGVMIAGVSPRLHFDEAYRGFLDLVASTVSAALANARVHELAETRAKLLHDLERKQAELEAFSYCVSHDLRAPLRGIDGFSQVLLEDHAGQLDEDGKRCLARVRAATKRMSQQIDDLLALSRVDRAELRRSAVDLGQVGARVVESLARLQPERAVTFTTSGDLVTNMDSRLAEILLENLLGNAWKFTSKTASARIEIGSCLENGERVFFVKDNGAGFDEKFAKRLFTPFQRLHTEDAFPGTGIGLATVRRIVDRHGGHVWAKAEVDAGATVYWTVREADS